MSKKKPFEYPAYIFIERQGDGDDAYLCTYETLDGVEHGVEVVKYARTDIVGTVEVTTNLKERD